MPTLTHDETKRLYLAYRETATQMIAAGDLIDSARLSVNDHANVQICEEGAFVELHVWIPKEQL